MASLVISLRPKLYNEEDALALVREAPMMLSDIDNQTTKICLEAVRLEGYALQFVKHQTPEICLVAVTTCPDALKFVREQTEEICLAAVKQDGLALAHVQDKYQSGEICLVAMEQDFRAYKYCNPLLIREAFRQYAKLSTHEEFTTIWDILKRKD